MFYDLSVGGSEYINLSEMSVSDALDAAILSERVRIRVEGAVSTGPVEIPVRIDPRYSYPIETMERVTRTRRVSVDQFRLIDRLCAILA